MNLRNVSFDGYVLENEIPGLQILELPDRPAVRKLDMSHIVATDKNTITDDYYASKKMNVICSISRADRASLDDALDTLKKRLFTQDGTLIVPYGSGSRQYTATLENISESNKKGGYVELDLEFECTDTSGYDTTNTVLVSSTLTGVPTTYNVTVDGTARFQYPVIQVILIAITGGDGGTITIANPADTGAQIDITRSWSNDDVLEIDSLNRTVTVNDVDVAFTGAFPRFELGDGHLYYSDDFTTRTCAVLVTYQKRYI